MVELSALGVGHSVSSKEISWYSYFRGWVDYWMRTEGLSHLKRNTPVTGYKQRTVGIPPNADSCQGQLLTPQSVSVFWCCICIRWAWFFWSEWRQVARCFGSDLNRSLYVQVCWHFKECPSCPCILKGIPASFLCVKYSLLVTWFHPRCVFNIRIKPACSLS
jgi:hypothetical protein